MKTLTLDTSNRPLSVAVLEDQRILATTIITTHKKHARYLLPIINNLMSEAGFMPKDLDRVVVANGPGSYTGIRIATATAKVLASCLNIELVNVSSLQTLALNVTQENVLVNPVFDARNNNLFTGLYRIKNGYPENVIPDQHTPLNVWLEQLKNYNETIIGLGDADHFKDDLINACGHNIELHSGMINLPQSGNLGLFGENKSPIKHLDTFVPNYLRLTKAEADWQHNHPKEVQKDLKSYVQKY